MDLTLSPKDGTVDLPDIGQGDVVDVRFDPELSALLDLLELLGGQSVFEGVLVLVDDLLLVPDVIELSVGNVGKHAFGELELEIFGVAVDIEGLVQLIEQLVGLDQERL